MRSNLKKIKFAAITILIVFTLVASNAVTHSRLDVNNQPPKPCLTAVENNCGAIATFPRMPTHIPKIDQTEQERFLAAIANNLSAIPQPNTYEYILLKAYGAAFINQTKIAKLPSTVLLNNEQETQAFQNTLTMVKVDGTNDCYLQAAAVAALNQARAEQNIPLKSGYGSGDCTRTFATNLRFWNKYANQSILDKVIQGKETAILSVVAPPGASQHLWGLAIDLRISNQQQRQTLNQHGWFQTVVNDVPHWTYLGLTEQDLLNVGLINKVEKGISYWVTPL
ncbi:MAG TPA: D-alanyl-D-alanine carboxypeptidase family protein [Trichormus sp. M33_DOE_039]|nr:D-alanyl-D-alanine carboxypeptidase family protein [Trichormus sp. M33_DOE_039]